MTPPEIKWEFFNSFAIGLFKIWVLYTIVYCIVRYFWIRHIKKSAKELLVELRNGIRSEQQNKEKQRTQKDRKSGQDRSYMTVSSKKHSQNMAKYDRRLEALKGYRVTNKAKEE